jgi:hypothetical protein
LFRRTNESRDHTGDLTEEMSGLKPTFYLL